MTGKFPWDGRQADAEEQAELERQRKGRRRRANILQMGYMVAAFDQGITPPDIPGLELWVRPDEFTNPNLLLWTEDIDPIAHPPAQGGWSIGGSMSITPGQTGPGGLPNAYLLNPGGTNSNLSQQRDSILGPFPGQGVSVVGSCWVKRDPGTYVAGQDFTIQLYDGVASQNFAFDPPEEWTRVPVVITTSAGTDRLRWQWRTGGLFTQTCLVALPQVQVGSVATEYFKNEGVPGGAISNWPDLSGNGRDMVQADDQNQPIVKLDSLSGYASALFDTVNDSLGMASALTFPDAYEHWTLWRRTPTIGDQIATLTGSGVNKTQIGTNGSIIEFATVGNVVLAASELTVDQYLLMRVSRSPAFDLSVSINNVDVTDGTPNLTSARSITNLFGYYTGGGLGPVEALEGAVFSRALEEAEVADLARYFAFKYPDLPVIVPVNPVA